MELLYTDISHDMTEILVAKAAAAAKAGKRVFYIAPNSLSFEKERAVLEALPEQASFAITITRFAQLARYFILNQPNQKESLDDAGLAMIFFRALNQIDDKELRLFAGLKKDSQFIKQLIDLYKELKSSQLTVLDLEHLGSKEKYQDMLTIFTAVEDLLREGDYDNQSKLAFFANEIRSSRLDEELREVVIVVDGFTRFSAEEEALVALLEEKCHQVIIGTYASQKAQRAAFSSGNIYQAGLDFMRQLAQQFHSQPTYVSSRWESAPAFKQVSQLLESQHDFTGTSETLTSNHGAIEIWEAINQKEEIEQVARAIRQKLYEGCRYKDILVLLGDVEAYKLQVTQVFELYDIPFYLGRAESMRDHPLVNVMESLARIKRYNFRAEDVMNLLKSGLYGQVSAADLDYFDAYVTYADIKGQKRFTTPFSQAGGRYDLERLNAIRENLLAPLEQLMKARKQLGLSLLKKLSQFFKRISLTENMAALTKDLTALEQERHEQVWKTFTDILQQFEAIFGDSKLTLEDCLDLLSAAILRAEYRVVPATVDVVTVKSYDLVEPHSKPLVFALGMTQAHFPKIAQNKSLLTDEERQQVNDNGEQGRLELVTQDNLKKNHFAALSLFNAATEALVLSIPQLLNEAEDTMSTYLAELKGFGVPVIAKQARLFAADANNLGNVKGLLSRLVSFSEDSAAISQEMTKEEATFWSVATRYLRKKLAAEGLTLPLLKDSVETQQVASEVMQARFPLDEPMHLSSSAVTTFYNNQYKYFLQYVLALKEQDSIHPDARHFGTYLHRVFELVAKDESEQDFDKKLDAALKSAQQEDSIRALYQEDAQGRYSLSVLDDIARATATIFKRHSSQQVTAEEESFELALADDLLVRGIIDRVDQLADGSFGIVDYKSSHQVFDIEAFYNGLSPQLVTYLAALRASKQVDLEQIFGAMYLHMQEPKLKLKDLKTLDKAVEEAHKEIKYRGLFSETEKEYLDSGDYQLKDNLYSQEELALLLDYNQKLYQKAATAIRKGQFLINPYTADGKSVQGDQLKAITGFEADRHMSRSRRLYHLPRKEKRQGFLTLMAEEEENDEL